MTVLITLTTAGLDSGPFSLFSNINGYSTPFETNINRSALVSGYTSTFVPESTTIIRVVSTGVCTNFIDISITGITTTTTSSTTTNNSAVISCYTVDSVTLAPFNEDCLGQQTTTQSEQFTVTLRNSSGDPVVATQNYQFTLQFNVNSCSGSYVDNLPVTINSGTSSTNFTNYTSRASDCGQGSCTEETSVYTGQSSPPSQLSGITTC